MTRRISRIALFVLFALPLAMLQPFAASDAGATTTGSSPQLPQNAAARQAAGWLDGQLTSQGYITVTSKPDLSATAQTVLALAAANIDQTGAQAALGYLQTHIDAYVTQVGADGPGQLALLILDAVALGDNPQSFGGTDLVTRLLATEQTTGTDAGLFGTDAQLTTYAAGTYSQGLALGALAAAGVRGTTKVTAADEWLSSEQCPNGGWALPDQTLNPCGGSPATFAGPDTNSTATAVQGLAAQGALTPALAGRAVAFFSAGQDADAGWSYMPSAATAPQTTQPTSTALVIQALLALGKSPTAATFTKGTDTPVSTLLSFQLTSGKDAGAFTATATTTAADLISTYEVVPALSGLSVPFGPSGTGYWQVASDGGLFSFGNSASFFGSMGGKPLNAPIVGLAPTTNGMGYWEVASDGGLFAFGNATFYGSMGGKPLNKPIVGMATTPTGGGYWEVASDGGLFAFGNATFYGSMGGKTLNQPIVGMATTPTGGGYWEVASDGGLFAFGNATYYGSMGGQTLNKPIVGLAATPTGGGYWEVASDGGLFAFGNATFYGSTGGKVLNAPVVGMSATPDGKGYWEVASDGGLFTFGDANFYGSMGGKPLNRPVVGMAVSPSRPA